MALSEDTLLENRYRIDGLLAQPDASTTYRGFDLQMKAPVAIKEKALESSQAINRFIQEALILSGLRHPALPLVMKNFSFEGKQYLVTDFINGASLWEIIEQNKKPLLEDHALQCMIRVCQGVSYLHQQKPPILHRDIKPHNIKFSPQGEAILLDFGIAKSGKPASELAVYMSPEQRVRRPMTPASDLFALGATLYTITTGETPPIESPQPGFDPAETHPNLNPKTSQAIAHALRLDPDQRPQSVAAWQKELEAALSAILPFGNQSAAALPPPVRLAEAADRTGRASQIKPVDPSGLAKKFWLVNPAGTGYPIESKKFTIGSAPEASIRLDDPAVAPIHLRVRVENERCLIRDENSGQSEYSSVLNDQRLESGWYPLDPGDILVIGSTRFYLTTIKPAKIAPTNKPPAAATAEAEAPAETRLAPGLSTPAQANKLGLSPALIVLLVILLASFIGGSLYLTRALGQTSASGSAAVASEAVASPTNAAQPESDEGQTPSPEPSATATPTEAVEAAMALVDAPTDTPTLTLTSTRPATATPIETTPTVEPTVSPTPASTATPTVPSLPSPTPTPAGPTVIPVRSDETIAEIGVQEVIDVDLNPKNPQEVYVIIKNEGVYKSSSGGSGPWTKLPFDTSSVTALTLDPSNPVRLYAPTWNAVLQSNDGGNSWLALTRGLLSNQTVDVVTVDPTDPKILFAGVGETLVISKDGGEDWQQAGDGLGTSRIQAIVIDPFDHNIVYVGGLAASAYKSVDGGATFTPLPFNAGQGVFGIAAHPNQRDTLLFGVNSGEAAIIRTEDGSGFNPVSDGLIYGGADSAYGAIAYAASNPNIVYAGSGHEDNLLAKGLFKSTNGGERWVQISARLGLNPDTQLPYYVKSIAIHPDDPNTVFAATGAGLYQSSDGGANWILR